MSHDDWVSLAQQQLKHMYMALATAKQFASFVLLCVILELIVGIWSRFDVFVPIDMIICHVDMLTYMQGKLGCLCYMLTIIVGIWPRFDVFVPTYLTRCHGHTYARLQAKLCCLYAYDMVMFRHFRAYSVDNMSLFVDVHLYSLCSFLLLPPFLQISRSISIGQYIL